MYPSRYVWEGDRGYRAKLQDCLIFPFIDEFGNVVGFIGRAIWAQSSADGDDCGIKASKKAVEELLQAGIEAEIAYLPIGFDPDSFLNKYPVAEFYKILGLKI